MRKYFREIRNAGAERLSVKARRGGASLQARRTRNRSDVRESRGIFVNRQHIGNIWGGSAADFWRSLFLRRARAGFRKAPTRACAGHIPQSPAQSAAPAGLPQKLPRKKRRNCPLPKKRSGAPKSAARRKSRERLRPSPARFGGHIYDFRRLVEIVADNQAALHIYNVLGYVGAQVRDAFEGF